MEKKFVVLLSWVYFISSFELGLTKSHILKSEVEEHRNSIYTPESTERIIGGKPTKEKKYPFMVSMHEKEGSSFIHVCGGVVLNENWILTAAHCIDYPSEPHKYLMLAGLLKLSQRRASTVQILKISEIFLHEDFDNITYVNDIALMKTTNPIDIRGSNGYVNSIGLPTTNEEPTGVATVIGWGHTYQDGDNSNTLREANVPIIDRELCNESYNYEDEDDVDDIRETMICAGMARRDACQNDSGGPLLQRNSKGKAILIGIVSHGTGCGYRQYPGVYTKVSSYKQWIENIMSK